MLYRLLRRLPAARFRRKVKRILETEPLRLSPSGVHVVSKTYPADLAPYLLALKSFAAAIPVGKVTAIIDRASPSDFRRTLAAHVPGITLVELESIPVGTCQRGGTWERLLYVLDQSAHEYVVQLDSDTLVLDATLPAVRACITQNRAFTLGGGPAFSGQKIVSMPEAATSLGSFTSRYVGIALQSRFLDYPGAKDLRYVRGSSGFTGFAKGGITRAAIEDFHAKITHLLGARAREWGTEQCASNFAIANTSDATVLPWPAYANFDPLRPRSDDTRFLHFIGTVRYHRGCYARLARQAIDRIIASNELCCPA